MSRKRLIRALTRTRAIYSRATSTTYAATSLAPEYGPTPCDWLRDCGRGSYMQSCESVCLAGWMADPALQPRRVQHGDAAAHRAGAWRLPGDKRQPPPQP